MKIFVDDNFKCHITNGGTMTAAETDFFDNKCATFVEGYRFIPNGKSWTRSDGVTFQGEMIAPCRDYEILQAAQQEYEKVQAEIEDMRAALGLLGVAVDE